MDRKQQQMTPEAAAAAAEAYSGAESPTGVAVGSVAVLGSSLVWIETMTIKRTGNERINSNGQ